jgi:hypothetical protein
MASSQGLPARLWRYSGTRTTVQDRSNRQVHARLAQSDDP